MKQRRTGSSVRRNQRPSSPPTGAAAGEGADQGERLLTETRLARFVRVLRGSDDLAGPAFVQTLAVIFYGLEHGLLPEDLDDAPPSERELREWTAPILFFLGAMSVSYRQWHPDVSDDTAWALAQVGVTANDLGMELESYEFEVTKRRIEELVSEIWAEGRRAQR